MKKKALYFGSKRLPLVLATEGNARGFGNTSCASAESDGKRKFFVLVIS